MWIPNPDRMWAHDGHTSVLQKRKLVGKDRSSKGGILSSFDTGNMRRRHESMVSQPAAGPSQKRASALERDEPLLLPEINKGNELEGLRRSPSLQDVPPPQSSLNNLTHPTQPNQSQQTGSLKYASQREGFSGTDLESKDRAIMDGEKQRVDFPETPVAPSRLENETPDLDEV